MPRDINPWLSAHRPSVIDGDTIEIHGARVRIFGIDAPESDQLCHDARSYPYRCGQKASNGLFDFIDRRPVDCVEVDRDRYKRAVSVCTVGGTDIADWLVRTGLARDWPQYSKGGYGSGAGRSQAGTTGHLGRQFQGAVDLSGLQTVRRKAGKLFRLTD